MNAPVIFSPGPSELYPTVPGHIAQALGSGVATMSHRSQEFSEIYAGTAAALRDLMAIPHDYHIWFLGSATESMERIIQNAVAVNSHHLVAGAFGKKFAQVATQLGKTITVQEAEWGSSFDLDDVSIATQAELIALTHNETSSGAALDPAAISRLHKRYPNKLIAVDIVSSAPHVELDFATIDCAFFSVQKGFGLPPGLGVLIASPRALAQSENLKDAGQNIGSYHSFPELAKWEAKHQTPETPNVLAIYLLGRVARDFLEYNPAKLRRDLSCQASRIYDYFDAHPHFAPLVSSPHYRSHTVLVVESKHGSRPVVDALSGHGLMLGTGYGHQKETHLRIANFPAHIGHTDRLLGMLERNYPSQSA